MVLITEVPLEQQARDQVILFQAADGQVTLDLRLEADNVWLSQAQMAALTHHVGNVFREGELPEKSNVHFLHIAGADRPSPRHPDKLVGNWLKLPHGTRHAIRRRV
jgi:hypothetical protein